MSENKIPPRSAERQAIVAMDCLFRAIAKVDMIPGDVLAEVEREVHATAQRCELEGDPSAGVMFAFVTYCEQVRAMLDY